MTTPTIDLTPTPAGLKRMRQVFLADAKRARENADRAISLCTRLDASWQAGTTKFSDDEMRVFTAALEAYEGAELDRAEKLEAGAAECLPGAVTVTHVHGGVHTPVTNADWIARAREHFLLDVSNPEHQPLYFPVNATGPVWTGATFVFPGCECIKVEA